MDHFIIHGGNPLQGTIEISGAKNAALPLMAAAILTDQPVTLHNLPNLQDINTMKQLLTHLGVEWSDGRTIRIHAHGIERPEAPYEIVKTMRASSLILGPLLARRGWARVSLPGGCAIGARPMDLHLKALEAMGAQVSIEDGNIVAQTNQLHGADVTFDIVTVTGTENVMMAATLAGGTTILRNAAREPEILDLANCLKRMGAKIEGAGTDQITIEGVPSLSSVDHTIIPDRIVAGTFMIAAAMTGGDLELTNVVPDHVAALTEKLRAAGATVTDQGNSLRVQGPRRLTSVDCTTAPYPAYATDLQAQWMAAMTTAEGTSTVTETIFENRFMHVAELKRIGANITVDDRKAVVRGVPQLHGAPVMATDLRASACLVLAGLAAEGKTTLQRVYHIDRGYEGIEKKLRSVGASIERIPNQKS